MTDPAYTDPQGRVWRCFDVEFDTQEGPSSCRVWAIDRAHALMRLEELKQTARLGDEIVGVVKA